MRQVGRRRRVGATCQQHARCLHSLADLMQSRRRRVIIIIELHDWLLAAAALRCHKAMNNNKKNIPLPSTPTLTLLCSSYSMCAAGLYNTLWCSLQHTPNQGVNISEGRQTMVLVETMQKQQNGRPCEPLGILACLDGWMS